MRHDPRPGSPVIGKSAGRLYFHLGDNSDFRAERMEASRSKQKPITSPKRDSGSMVYDGAAGKMVLFGGSGYWAGCDNSSAVCNDIWTYDGVTWTQHLATIAPSPRAGASIAYDSSLNSIIVFGGSGGPSTPFGDTWTYEPR